MCQGTGQSYKEPVPIGNTWISPMYCALLRHFGVTEVRLNDDPKREMLWSVGEVEGVLMPMKPPAVEKKP
jgi:hypothetical protein